MLVAAVAAPTAVAHAAAAPKFDVWQGQTKTKKASVLLVHQQGRKKVQVSVTATCKNAEGNRTTTEFSVDGKLSASGSVSVTKGGMKLTATAKKGKAATGSVTYEVPEANGGCKATESFKVKYTLSRGG
jgi:hypothetical protein